MRDGDGHMIHWAGRYGSNEGQNAGRWFVFSELLFDGESEGVIMSERGPFPTQRAAEACADVANAEGVEDITPGMIANARLKAFAVHERGD